MFIRARQHVEMGLLVLVASASAFALYGACVPCPLPASVSSRLARQGSAPARRPARGEAPEGVAATMVDSRLTPHAARLYALGLYDRRGAAALLGAKEVPVARRRPRTDSGDRD